MYITTSTGGVWVNAFREYGIVGQGSSIDISACSGNVTHPISCDPLSTFFIDHIEDVGIRCRGMNCVPCVIVSGEI